MYSVSQLDNATVGCRLEDQLIAPLPKLNKNPEVNLRVSRSPSQSASVYPARDSKGPLNVSSRSKVSLIYRKILLTACQWELFGREAYRLTTETA